MLITCRQCGTPIEQFGKSWIHSADKNITCPNLRGIASPSLLQHVSRHRDEVVGVVYESSEKIERMLACAERRG